ncbi:DNA polymerase IV [Corynebacterium sp. H128]|uniref:DNA polymerase IV n=1 Tax=unclassified Corynebacterium TaxID=2624378 RepID=UPI0030B7945C
MQRWVLHIDMDAFFASVEQLTRPTLRGRPVLVGGLSGRGVVAGASYEARAFGAKSAMPMYQARALVGFGVVTVQPRHAVYATASRRVFEIIRARAGIVEQLSIDEGFMEPAELVGASPEEVREWSEELRALIKAETGLPASIGAGSGKQFAKIGSGEAKPDGVFVVPVDRQHELLDPLPVRKLWGIGPVAEAKLKQQGVATIADFAAMSRRDVEISLGKNVGVALWHLARGNDDRPVAPRAEAKQVSAEHTYPEDLTTRAQVDAAVERSARSAHRRLLRDGRGARTVTVKTKLATFASESRSLTLPYATDDLSTLHASARKLTRYAEEVGPIRLIGVSFSGLESERQDVLFPELDQNVVVVESQEYEAGVRDTNAGGVVSVTSSTSASPAGDAVWHSTQDVYHPEFGHGWVQGAGHGVVSVRFETRSTDRGKTRSFAIDDPDLVAADPLDSLDWEDWFATQESPGDGH